ncbi:MAG: hypothetical protein ACOYBJ_02575 [Patescibacteria group bacterium]|jgi:hypothetical protein
MLRQAAAIVSELPQAQRMAAWKKLDDHAEEIVALFGEHGPYCCHTDDHAHEGEFGCGYLRLVYENPELYAVEHPPFVESLVAALKQEHRPIERLVTLKGKHEEQAVLVLKFEGDRVARVVPEFEGTQNFVAIPQVEEQYRSETFPVFLKYCNEIFGAEVGLESAREKLESLSLGHQTHAPGALAKGKPIIEIVFGTDEQVKSVRTL